MGTDYITYCVDVPNYQPEGVWYTYSGQDPVFVPGGVYWTCPKDEPFKVYAVVALVTTSVQVPTGIPSNPFTVVTGKGYVQVIVAGEPVDTIVPDMNYTYHTQGPFALPGELTPYGAMVITTRGVFSAYMGDCTNCYHNPSITPPPDPIDNSDRLPAYLPTKIDNIVQLSSTFLGNIYPLGSTTPSYTFTIYDKDGTDIFHQTSTECPNARHQAEKCEYTGDFKCIDVYIPAPEMFATSVTAVNTIEDGLYCTTLFSVGGSPAPMPARRYSDPLDDSISALIVGGPWCSPKGCKSFPKTTNKKNKYSDTCPPGTCEIDCGSTRCCYDSEGNLVKTIPTAPSPSPVSSDPSAAGSYSSAMTSEDTSGTSSPSDFLGSP